MAAVTTTKAFTNSTDANFREWGKAISDQMIAGGWVFASDTGQINWTTVLAPVAVSTVQGYEIFRSNDASGGITQLYVKIEYGSGASSANNPSVWITVGWASDGAGALTGVTTTRRQVSATAVATASMNLAAGLGWFAMALGTVNNQTMLFSVERTLDSSLVQKNEVLKIWNNSGTWGTQVAEQSVVAYTVETTNGTIVPTSANAVVSGIVGIGLVFGTKAGFTSPSLNVTGCNNTQLGAAGGTVNIFTHGASHTFIINTNITSLNMGALSNVHSLTRFE